MFDPRAHHCLCILADTGKSEGVTGMETAAWLLSNKRSSSGQERCQDKVGATPGFGPLLAWASALES